jgi:hypothetical protein
MKILKKENYNLYFIKDIDENDFQEWKEKGYLPCDTEEKPQEKSGYNIVENFSFDEETQRWKHYWELKFDKEKASNEIAILKQQLTNTDYKVIKNMEYQMAMMATREDSQVILDLYDPKELHDERQALRDRINELEQLLKE